MTDIEKISLELASMQAIADAAEPATQLAVKLCIKQLRSIIDSYEVFGNAAIGNFAAIYIGLEESLRMSMPKNLDS